MEIQDYTGSEFKHALARNLRSLTRGKKSSKQTNMSADIVYLTASHNELRRKRELFPENDNFICYVQYDRSKKFPIHNIIVDSY